MIVRKYEVIKLMETVNGLTKKHSRYFGHQVQFSNLRKMWNEDLQRKTWKVTCISITGDCRARHVGYTLAEAYEYFIMEYDVAIFQQQQINEWKRQKVIVEKSENK